MKKQPKKLTLNKETLRDLMAHDAGEVKGGRHTHGKRCQKPTEYGPTCPGYTYGCPTTAIGCT